MSDRSDDQTTMGIPAEVLAARDKFEQEYWTSPHPCQPFIVGVGIEAAENGYCISVMLYNALPSGISFPYHYEGIPVHVEVVGRIVGQKE